MIKKWICLFAMASMALISSAGYSSGYRIPTLDYASQKALAEDAYALTAESTVTSGSTFSIAFETDASAYGLYIVDLFSDAGLAGFEFLENAGIGTDGTTMTAYNRNRAGDNLSAFYVYQDATITTGTQIENVYFGGGAIGAWERGRTGATSAFWLLKPSTSYVLRVTSKNGTAHMSMSVSLYED